MHAHSARLYVAESVRELERRAIEICGIPGYELMHRAAMAAWAGLCAHWPAARRITVVAGPGNNGGDGYELARLARAAGCEVQVVSVGGLPRQGDAVAACANWHAQGGVSHSWSGALPLADVVVDALFGLGLSRVPEGDVAAAIEAIRAARGTGCGVLALDLPSGLDATRGVALGTAVEADLTVTFIGDKLGLHTADGPDYSGHVIAATLEVPEAAYEGVAAAALRLEPEELRAAMPRRRRSAHKNRHGHVLLVGGNRGMGGATLLAARAALRCGAGLVSVATHPAHAAALTAAQPELMCHGVTDASELESLLARANAVAIGPGLGQDAWARGLWARACAAGLPLIVDADALNLLAEHAVPLPGDAVLTPHPGEAARLLGLDSGAAVQGARLAAVHALRTRYGGAVVLKGAGTLIAGQKVWLCPYGNPGMAVAGMGDVLTGIIVALRAQGLTAEASARCGVLIHALAGDRAAQSGQRGLLPSDLIEALREQVNSA